MRLFSRHKPLTNRRLSSSRPLGMATLETVLIFALSMMILASVYWLWSEAKLGDNANDGLKGQTVAILDRLLQQDFADGSPADQGTGGPDAGGGSTGGGSTGGGSTGGGSTGGGSTPPGSGSGTAADDGKNTPDSGSTGNSGKNQPNEPDPAEGDVESVGNGLTIAVAKGIMENSGNRVIDATKAALQNAKIGKDVVAGRFEQARDLFRGALVDPTLSGGQVEVLRQNLLSQEKLYQQASDTVDALEKQVSLRTNLLTWATGAIEAVVGAKALWDADQEIKRYARMGETKMAWKTTCRTALGFIAQTYTAGKKILGLEGVGGAMAEEAVQLAAETVGNELGELSFGTMNDLSHWLYGQSWWPKNRKPRDLGSLAPRKPEPAMFAATGRSRLVRRQLRDGIRLT